jgi:hypothetical protein
MERYWKSRLMRMAVIGAGALAAAFLLILTAIAPRADAQTPGGAPQTAVAPDTGVSAGASAVVPAADAGQPASVSTPPQSVAAQTADAGQPAVDTADPEQTTDQAPRPGPPPGPRGPMSVQGPARGGPPPRPPFAVQAPGRGPGGAGPGPRRTGRRRGPYSRPGPARPALAPRLPNSGTGGLLDTQSALDGISPWMPAALLLATSALGAAGAIASRRRS